MEAAFSCRKRVPAGVSVDSPRKAKSFLLAVQKAVKEARAWLCFPVAFAAAKAPEVSLTLFTLGLLAWHMASTPMGFARDLYRVPMEFVRDLYGAPLGFVRGLYGIPMGFVRALHGAPVGFVRDPHGICKGAPWIWDSHGICKGLAWSPFGNCKGFPWAL